MSSLELTKWMALLSVHADERKHEQDIIEDLRAGGAGEVFDGRQDDEDDDGGDGPG